MSIPVATAQCHKFLREHLPNANLLAATSTAGAAKSVAEESSTGLAAIAPRVAADLYGLSVLAEDIEDEEEIKPDLSSSVEMELRRLRVMTEPVLSCSSEPMSREV